MYPHQNAYTYICMHVHIYIIHHMIACGFLDEFVMSLVQEVVSATCTIPEM